MSTVTFVTHEFIGKLRAAGFDEKQAEAVIRVVADAQSQLVYKEHFDTRLMMLETKIEAKFDKMNWMMGIMIALASASFAKQYF
jgi:hypothetical protein